jgi:septum formation protein
MDLQRTACVKTMSATSVPDRLVLASSSPRRRELLEKAGFRFRVVVPPIQEPTENLGHLPPAQLAEALAYFKAREVADQHPTEWVLGADTIVVVGGRILGKPADAEEAREMLTTLSGTRHTVITGVALLGPDEHRLIASETTHVTVRDLSPAEVEDYVAGGEWMGKAGAYAIQETADRFVVRIEGSLSNVVGLPMELVARMIEELRAHPGAHKAV